MSIILLPPSESKDSAHGRTKLKLNDLAFPELAKIRADILAELIRVCNGPAKSARQILGVSEKQQWEIERNQQLMQSAVAPAWQIYTGVLYDALSFETLTKSQQTKLEKMAFVQSALFGLIAIGNHMPAYRLSGDCNLPKRGALTKVWALACSEALASTNDFVVDLRSGIYQKLGPLPKDCDAVIPKIMQRMPAGPPKVVSHHNKATKGRIVRAIAQSPRTVNAVDSLAEVVSELGAEVEIQKSEKLGQATVLQVVVDLL